MTERESAERFEQALQGYLKTGKSSDPSADRGALAVARRLSSHVAAVPGELGGEPAR